MSEDACDPLNLLRSQRLSYRRLSQRAVEAFHAPCREEHVKRYLLDGADMPHAWAVEAVEISDRLFQTDGVGLWLVERDEVPVGFSGFRMFHELSAEPQLLYAVSGDYVGSGHATEAVGTMLAETRRLGWSRVVAAVDHPNTASMRVLEKTGFVGCGRVPGNFGHTSLFERFDQTPPERLTSKAGSRWALQIQHTWDGDVVGDDEAVALAIELGDIELTVRVAAPFHDDPPPDTDDLWNHEVVELMLLGADDRYLEVELSPCGQHLVLFLQGERNVVHRGVALDFRADVDSGRWLGVAHIPLGWVPFGTNRLNALAIHGREQNRRYLAWKPTGGSSPDFHRLAAFGSFDDCRMTEPP